MGWRYVLCDENGVAIGEPEASGRSFSPAVSATETAACRVRVGSSLWSQLEAGLTLKTYNSTGDLVFYGDIVTDELNATGQGGTVQLNAADLSFRLKQRFVGKDKTGVGLSYINQDARAIAFDILNQVNTDQPTGITVGNGYVALTGGGGTGPVYGVPGTFGNTVQGITNAKLGADTKQVIKSTLTERATVSKLTGFFGGSHEYSPGTTQAVKAVIYADAGGVPGAKIAEGTEVTIDDYASYTWYDLPFGSPPTIDPGDYWLGYISGGTSLAIRFQYSPTGGVRATNADAYSDGASNPFGAVGSDTLNLSVYASYVTVPPAPESTAFVGPTVTYLWKNALDAISELGAIASSYEWQLRYRDGTPPTVYLDLFSQIGEDKTKDVFLEYGTKGKGNVPTLTRTRSVQSRASHVYTLGSGSTLVGEAYDAAADAARRAEDVVSVGEIADQVLLDALAAEHVAVRRTPRTTISMSLMPQNAPKYGLTFAPRYGVEWAKGDTVTARAFLAGETIVNGAARVWGADITIDDLGNENAVPTLEPSG
jgi:hypothetical protein